MVPKARTYYYYSSSNLEDFVPKFRVIVYDKVVQRASKIFEADSQEDAHSAAESDVWSTENGWSEWEEDSWPSESYIENIEEIKEYV